jgi:hypothetical protein
MVNCLNDLQWYLNTNRYFIIKDDIEYLADFLCVSENQVRSGIKVREAGTWFVARFSDHFLSKEIYIP